MPAACIQAATAPFTWRIASDANGRVRQPRSSLKLPRISHRSITMRADVWVSMLIGLLLFPHYIPFAALIILSVEPFLQWHCTYQSFTRLSSAVHLYIAPATPGTFPGGTPAHLAANCARSAHNNKAHTSQLQPVSLA